MLIVSIDSSAYQGQLGLKGIDLDQLMTQESDCEIMVNKRPTKALWKEKSLRCILDYIHLNSLASSYNHHSMFYSQGRKNVSQSIPNHVSQQHILGFCGWPL
jgi:hypothetical protein